MLVQFERVVAPQDPDFPVEGSGEDEGFGTAEPIATFLDVNPRYVSMVFASREPGVTIIKGPDGRGFKVKGEFADVHQKLVAAGLEDTATQH